MVGYHECSVGMGSQKEAVTEAADIPRASLVAAELQSGSEEHLFQYW